MNDCNDGGGVMVWLGQGIPANTAASKWVIAWRCAGKDVRSHTSAVRKYLTYHCSAPTKISIRLMNRLQTTCCVDDIH